MDLRKQVEVGSDAPPEPPWSVEGRKCTMVVGTAAGNDIAALERLPVAESGEPSV